VEITEPNLKSYYGEVYSQLYINDINDYNNRTHHPIANLESGWWKEGEVKGDDELMLQLQYLSYDGVTWINAYGQTESQLHYIKRPFRKVAVPLKTQPMKEEWSKEPHFAGTKEMTDSKDNTPEGLGEQWRELEKRFNPSKDNTPIEAIEFAEWIHKKKYMRVSSEQVLWGIGFENTNHTTAELYQIFKTQKP
jgi:hypothetical protein